MPKILLKELPYYVVWRIKQILKQLKLQTK